MGAGDLTELRLGIQRLFLRHGRVLRSRLYHAHRGACARRALFRGFLSERGQLAMDVLATLVGAAITIFAASAMIQFAWRSFSRGSVSPTIDATPLVIPQGAIAFGLTLLALQMIARLVRLLTGAPPEDEATRESFNVE